MEQKENGTPVAPSGRIVMPPEVRQAMGWGEKTPVEIWLNATSNEVVIRKHEFACTFCGATNNLITFQRQFVCKSCIMKLARL